MAIDVYAWLNHGDNLRRIKRVVQIFDNESELYEKLGTSIVPMQSYNIEDRIKVFNKLRKGIASYTTLELLGYSSNPRPREASRVPRSLILLVIYRPIVFKEVIEWSKNDNAVRFLKLIFNLGFVSYNPQDDTFSITELGKQFSKLEFQSKEEKDFLVKAILASKYNPR